MTAAITSICGLDSIILQFESGHNMRVTLKKVGLVVLVFLSSMGSVMNGEKKSCKNGLGF